MTIAELAMQLQRSAKKQYNIALAQKISSTIIYSNIHDSEYS